MGVLTHRLMLVPGCFRRWAEGLRGVWMKYKGTQFQVAPTSLCQKSHSEQRFFCP